MSKKVADSESQQEAPGLSEVIRKALAQLGLEASGGDVKGWISLHYPTFTYNDGTFNSTVSNQKKKLREAEPAKEAPTQVTKQPPAKRQPSVATTLTVAVMPTGEDLLKVKRIADDNGGIEELLKQVQTVHDLASDVGGADKLLKCLEMLHELVK